VIPLDTVIDGIVEDIPREASSTVAV